MNIQFIILSILLSIMTSVHAQDRPTLIYIGDPMCSWCYGFGDELESAISQLEGHVEIEVVMGGLRPYNTETMSDLKDFLTEHWHHVAQASGRPFKYDILDTDILYDTEPASRAVVIVRDMDESQVMPFFHRVQASFYEYNAHPLEADTYADIAADLGLERQEFSRRFASPEYQTSIKQDFLRASQLGVRSFPTVLLRHEGELHQIAVGYTTADKIVKSVMDVIKP